MTAIEPMQILTVAKPCFIVATDQAMHFGDCPPVASGFGAVLKEIEHPGIFSHLEEFIAAEEPDWVGKFSLVVPESQSPVLLGRLRVEADRSEQLEISLHLEREEFEDQAPVFLEIAILTNKLDHLLHRLRGLLAKGEHVPHAVRIERARVKFLTRTYWEMLHSLCVSELAQPRFRTTGSIGHIIEAIRVRFSEAVKILRPNDRFGTVDKDIETLFEFLSSACPEEWEVSKELVPEALLRVGTVVDRSTSPEGVFAKSIEESDAKFRRAAAAHIRAFTSGTIPAGLAGASGQLLPQNKATGTASRAALATTPASGASVGSADTESPSTPEGVPGETQLTDPKLGALVHLGAGLVLAPEALTVMYEGKPYRFHKRRKERFKLLRLLGKRANRITTVADLFRADRSIGWESKKVGGHGLRNAAKRLSEELEPVFPSVAAAIEITEERRSHSVVFNWPPAAPDSCSAE